MHTTRYDFDLQHFAEGGDSGEGSAAGAGQTAQQSTGIGATPQTGNTQTKGGGDARADGSGAGAAPKMTWSEIMKDPEYNREMTKTVSQATKKAKAEADKYRGDLDALNPALKMLAEKYGLTGDMDYGALAKAITDDDAYYEDMALQMGVSVEQAKRQVKDQRELDNLRQFRDETLREQSLQAHFAGLQQQAVQLKAKYPSFDLGAELQNPAFVRMTSPEGGLTVEQAFHALHYSELMEAQAQAVQQRTASNLSRNIQAGKYRPAEHGAGGAVKAPARQLKYADLTPEQKEELWARAQRGEQITDLNDIF